MALFKPLSPQELDARYEELLQKAVASLDGCNEFIHLYYENDWPDSVIEEVLVQRLLAKYPDKAADIERFRQAVHRLNTVGLTRNMNVFYGVMRKKREALKRIFNVG